MTWKRGSGGHLLGSEGSTDSGPRSGNFASSAIGAAQISAGRLRGDAKALVVEGGVGWSGVEWCVAASGREE